MKKIVCIFMVSLFLVVSLPVGAQETEATSEMSWWNDRVFYQIFVRSFEDSDGDGIGDLQGIINKLDYLNDGDPDTTSDLGITGIWLMPIFQSPSYHGYDVIDYMTVESDYGTNDDFKALVAAAHERGIAVIIDMVINHTSREHPWFQDAQTPGSTHDAWYRWSINKPLQIGPWGQQVWHGLGNRYYYGVFWDGMPDLNLRNPAVTQSVYDIARFWLADMGADGFRMDGVRYLVEDDNTLASAPGTLTWLDRWQQQIDSINPDALTVGEIWTNSFEIVPYVPGGVDIAFEFDLATAMLNSAKNGSASTVTPIQERALRLFPAGQYATFLTNHDQNRVMNEVNQNIGENKVAASMMLTNPGVPFIYYGEEIGMIGVKPDECIRTPMQWDSEPRDRTFMAGKNCKMNPDAANVADEMDDPDSLLSHYRNLVHLRNAHIALRAGDMQVLSSDSPFVYSFIRHHADETLLVVINLSDEAVVDYGLNAVESALSGRFNATLLYGEGELAALEVGEAGAIRGYLPLAELGPYSTTIIGLDAIN